MYRRFDQALRAALTTEFLLYGGSERCVALATARRASAENRVKAMNEATLGKTGFAAIHDTASSRYHEDAERMASGEAPVHHAISFYLKTAEYYRKMDSNAPKKTAPAVATHASAQAA